MTEREQLTAGLKRIRDGGLTLGNAAAVAAGIIIALPVLSIVVVLDLAGIVLHTAGHLIRDKLSQPALDFIIGVPARIDKLIAERDKRV